MIPSNCFAYFIFRKEYNGKISIRYKGMQQVERYHEKNATVKNDKKAHVQALLKKAGKKK